MNIQKLSLTPPTMVTANIAPIKPEAIGATVAEEAPEKTSGFGKALVDAIQSLDSVQQAADGKALEPASRTPAPTSSASSRAA